MRPDGRVDQEVVLVSAWITKKVQPDHAKKFRVTLSFGEEGRERRARRSIRRIQ
jgi:hypothetical protein